MLIGQDCLFTGILLAAQLYYRKSGKLAAKQDTGSTTVQWLAASLPADILAVIVI